MKHDAKLAHQNLRLSRGTDVFTISSGGRGVSVYVTFFYASGPPVVKLDAIPFGASCRDMFLIKTDLSIFSWIFPPRSKILSIILVPINNGGEPQ